VDLTGVKEDEQREKNDVMPTPFRFGKGVEVDYNLQNSGEWFSIGNGRVWKLKISSKGAYSINLVFGKLALPRGATLYLYNEERTMSFGPITSRDVPSSGRFMSDLLEGETVVLELLEPKVSENLSVVQISRVIHAFKDLFIPNLFGDSNPCNIDINCSQGNNWQEESDGVAMIILGNGERLCSGALLNNGCQDFAPTVLSAFHCVDIGDNINNIDPCNDAQFGNGILTPQEIGNAENWTFRFQYKTPTCNGGEPHPSIYYSFQQATFRAGWFDTDFVLLEMNQRPGTNVDTGIRYLGWDRAVAALTSGATIHHPVGDVMKISVINNAAQSNFAQIAWTLCVNPLRQNFSPANTHWNVTLNQGTAQGGSSGGPLFNQDRRVVGQLHGGLDGCAPVLKSYGRFDVSWGMNNNGTFPAGRNPNNSLGPWLTNNPTITNTNTLAIPTLVRSTNSVCTGTSGTVSINNVPAGHNVAWSTTSNLTIVSSNNSSATIRHSGSGNGIGTVTATLSNPNTGLCPVTVDFSTDIQAGPFQTSNITVSGTAGVCKGTLYTYTANVPFGHQSEYSYSWTYPSNWSFQSQNTFF